MKNSIKLALGCLCITSLCSCMEDEETAKKNKMINIMETIVDEDSADKASGDLYDVMIESIQYKKAHSKTNAQFQKLLNEARKKNYYNSEKLREALNEI